MSASSVERGSVERDTDGWEGRDIPTAGHTTNERMNETYIIVIIAIGRLAFSTTHIETVLLLVVVATPPPKGNLWICESMMSRAWMFRTEGIPLCLGTLSLHRRPAWKRNEGKHPSVLLIDSYDKVKLTERGNG